MMGFPENEQERLARLLLSVPIMQSQDGRTFVLDQMRRRRFTLNVVAAPAEMAHCMQIIDAAMGRNGALQCLAHVISFVDRSDAALTFRQYVEREYPNEFLAPRERDDLIRELDPLVPRSKLITYYRAATDELTQIRFENLDQVVSEIEQMPWDEPGHPLIRLIEIIADNAGSKSAAQTARQWSDLLADRIDIVHGNTAERESLDRLRSNPASLSAAVLGKPTLTVELHPIPPRPEHYHFVARLFLGHTRTEKIFQSEDSDPLTLPVIKEKFVQVLDSALTMADRTDPNVSGMDLEFLLPRNLLGLPIEEWTNRKPAYRSLGVQFVVVVRDLARLDDLACRLAWKEKWATMQQHADDAYTTLHRWITCDVEPGEPGQVYRDLLACDCVSIGLTFPPWDGAHTFELAEALDAGMPIAVWPHACQHSGSPKAERPETAAANFKEMLSQQLAGHPLTELPKIVRRLRMTHQLAPGQGMTLLWDDPTRLPDPDNYNLAAPKPQESI
jgi:hypothetical protein